MIGTMKTRVLRIQPPQHQRYEQARHWSLIDSLQTTIVTLIAIVTTIAIITWRQTTPVLLDSTAFQSNSAAVGSAFSGYNPQKRETDLGHFSGSNYPGGLLVNYIPLDLSRNVELDADIVLDTHKRTEGIAFAFRPASTRSEAWDLKSYFSQGFGIAGYSHLFGFKLDLHPTSQDNLQKSSCDSMCSSDPQGGDSPFGAFVATGVDSTGKSRLERPGFLQVLQSGIAPLDPENLEGIRLGSKRHFSLSWDASSQIMTAIYGDQKWEYNCSRLVSPSIDYWLVIASSNSDELKKYHTTIKINTFVANISPTAMRRKIYVQ